MAIEIEVSGMSCAHCVSAVREALAAIPSVEVEDVSIGRARLRYDGDGSDLESTVRKALEQEGYLVERIDSVR